MRYKEKTKKTLESRMTTKSRYDYIGNATCPPFKPGLCSAIIVIILSDNVYLHATANDQSKMVYYF